MQANPTRAMLMARAKQKYTKTLATILQIVHFFVGSIDRQLSQLC